MVTDFFLSPFGNNDTVLEPGCDEEESINPAMHWIQHVK